MDKISRRFALSRLLCILAMICSLTLVSPSVAQMPELSRGKVPTLAPLVREVTPSVVNISAQGRVKEDNPFYRDPLFREYVDVPAQLERKIQSVGSGVIVDAQRGYVLTANHVVEQVSTVQVTTKDGRSFIANRMGRDAGTDLSFACNHLNPSRPSPWATATASKLATS